MISGKFSRAIPVYESNPLNTMINVITETVMRFDIAQEESLNSFIFLVLIVYCCKRVTSSLLLTSRAPLSTKTELESSPSEMYDWLS